MPHPHARLHSPLLPCALGPLLPCSLAPTPAVTFLDNWTRSELVYHNRHGWARNLLLDKYPVLDEFPDEVAVY